MTPCKVPDCPREHAAKGYCITHYRNWRRNGQPTYTPPDPERRFWERVDQSGGADACWPWIGACSSTGYGVVRLPSVGGIKGSAQGTHRRAWELANGRAVADGLVICHHCDNRPCCNPAHLFEGTQADNIHDMHAKGRAANQYT